MRNTYAENILNRAKQRFTHCQAKSPYILSWEELHLAIAVYLITVVLVEPIYKTVVSMNPLSIVGAM